MPCVAIVAAQGAEGVDMSSETQAVKSIWSEGDIMGYRALSSRALIVAVKGGWGWRAYADAVPGECHKAEARRVACEGCHLRREHAAHFFPHFDIEKYED